MQQRRRIGAVVIILIGIAAGIALKNIRIGLVIGLLLGLAAGGLLNTKR